MTAAEIRKIEVCIRTLHEGLPAERETVKLELLREIAALLAEIKEVLVNNHE